MPPFVPLFAAKSLLDGWPPFACGDALLFAALVFAAYLAFATRRVEAGIAVGVVYAVGVAAPGCSYFVFTTTALLSAGLFWTFLYATGRYLLNPDRWDASPLRVSRSTRRNAVLAASFLTTLVAPAFLALGYVVATLF